MKKIWTLMIIVVVTLGLSGCIGYEEEITVFTDSTGVQWRVLAEDGKGNQLIITEYVHGLVQYNSSNVYTFLGQSDGLRIALNAWFVDTLAPELRENALLAGNVDNDVRLTIGDDVDLSFFEVTVHENEAAGWTVAATGAASPENSLFVLSISEVNKYSNLGTLNIQGKQVSPYGNLVPAAWWLRSPGSCSEGPVALMSAGDTKGAVITVVPATEKYGFRPALWISR